MKKYISFFATTQQYISESIKWKYVIRDGKRVKKPTSTTPGMHIEYSDSGTPKEVRTTGAEKTQMSKQAKKTARKSKSKRSSTQRKIAKSTAKHTW